MLGMDGADSGARQSNTSANSDHHQRALPYQPYRDTQDRQQLHDQSSAMATGAVLHPSASYPPPSSAPYSSAYPQPPATNGTPTTAERKTDDMDPLKRQSLPSISEVISGTKSYPPPPPSTTAQQSNTSFPSPFGNGAGASRSFTESEKQPSPQSMRSVTTAYPTRHEATSSFAESPRAPYSVRPSLPPVPDRRQSPINQHDVPPPHHMSDPHKESRPLNGGYPQPPLPAAASSAAYPNGQLPPGQLPLPHYPASPRYGPQPHGYAAHYDQRGQPIIDERDRVRHQPEYFDTPSYQEALSRMAQSSRVIYSFSDAYSKIAHEQHGSYHFPERLPSDMEVTDMIAHADAVRHSLEYMREVVQRNERADRAYMRSDGVKVKGPYDDEDDVGMYGDSMKTQYALTEVKKRRGRAAPPGRCHSCNRVDTPEWRRGPDGARTLCNACGLHYAKLERKRQIEARSIRPKNDDRK